MLSADDFGVMRGTHHPIQNDNDHLAGRPAKTIQRCLDALVSCGLLDRFEHQGKCFVFQPDWQSWQKVSYPRTTTHPCPPISGCDVATQRLFTVHPGGAGRKRSENIPETVPEPSVNIPIVVPESSPLMRGRAPAKRLTANGIRLMANGSEGGAGETAPRMDRWFEELKAAYPPSAVSSGHLTMTAFVDAMLSHGTPEATFTVLMINLANQKQGHQWRVKSMIPRLDRWLREGLWEQQHEAAPPSTLVSDKTVRVLTSGAAFAAGGDDGTH